MDHVPEDYGDAPDEHGVLPATYQALERHLPCTVRAAPRDQKLAFMRRVLHQAPADVEAQLIEVRSHRRRRPVLAS
jgi:hypothetical protein